MIKKVLFSYILHHAWLLEWMIRLFGADKMLSPYFLSRSLTIGISYADACKVFSRIRSMEHWVKEWYRLGLYWENLSKIARKGKRFQSYAELCLKSRAAYHMAQFPFFGDDASKEKVYERCRRMYENAAFFLTPAAAKIEIAWQGITLPGYFRAATGDCGKTVVIVGGIDGVKEEMHYYSEFFLPRGYSVLYFDPPGIGECWKRSKINPDFTSIGQAVFDYLKSGAVGRVDRIALLGFSLGGNIVLHMATLRSYHACISVCNPFKPEEYFDRLSFLVHDASLHIVGRQEPLPQFLKEISLENICPEVACPVLVIGAGKDNILPPDESRRTFAALRQDKKIIYYPDATHCCPEYAFEMLVAMEEWLEIKMS